MAVVKPIQRWTVVDLCSFAPSAEGEWMRADDVGRVFSPGVAYMPVPWCDAQPSDFWQAESDYWTQRANEEDATGNHYEAHAYRTAAHAIRMARDKWEAK